MGLTLVSPPTGLVVTDESAKTYCRVDGTADDAAIAELVAAATDYVEQWLGRSLLEQTWRLSLDGFADEMLLPRGPVRGVSSIKYTDVAGDEQTLGTEIYTADLDSDPQRVLRTAGASWPAVAQGPNSVRIQFVAGYETVPPSVTLAIRRLVASWFSDREAVNVGNIVSEMPHSIADLLCSHRSFAGA